MIKIKPYDYDIIYLSYDEPNAEENYYDIKQKIPWAKRVHGVEGSDAAHKACAELAETERFITVDGDNKISENFINEEVSFSDDVDIERCVVSWSAYNVINGLTYGNGGIKCWPTELVKTMRTHENADPNNTAAGIDFCWDLEYLQINRVYSYVYNNFTPQQAWRAGFREGVKMSLLEGLKPSPESFCKQVPKKNLDRLKIWQTVGADIKNGTWAIYGAREGCYKTMCTDWDYVNVRNFEYLNTLWKTEYSKIQEDKLDYEIMGLGYTLNHELDLQIPVDYYETEQSKFFKSVYIPPSRTPKEVDAKPETAEYDIVMISYNEPNAEKNYNQLVERFPRAKRVHGVKGIPAAHKEAAKLCSTDLIWIVDGDAEIADDFNFDYKSPDNEKHFVKVWRSINPINGLQYGYGGVKLFPRQATLDMDITKPDMTTSISRHFKPMKSVSNTTAFNTDAFSAWKSGFRECAKLSAKVIDRQKSDETNDRLKVWTTVGKDRPFGEYALAGANAGMEFGLSDSADLTLINDFDWLKEQFDVAYPQETLEKPKIKVQKIVDLLDRFECMYDGLSDIRRLYNDEDVSSVFKIADNEELRKAVMEKNIHSILRLTNASEDLRKAVIEKNTNALFRVLGPQFDDLRKSFNEDNLHSILRVSGADTDLRKAVLEQNFYSMARLLPEVADEFKLLQNDEHALWRVLEKYTGSLFVPALKKLDNIDMDCFSRGQIQSKKWLVDTLKELDLDLRTVFLCAGWYATIVPMLSEANIKFDKIRSFDIDDSVWKIAETFNKHLQEGWRFKAQTKDIMDINYLVDDYTTVKGNGDIEKCKDSPDTIINTSCEHIEKFEEWFAKIPKGKLIILQSNNYFELPEHVNCVKDSLHFAEMAPFSKVLFTGELELEKYTRYMRIGIK